MILLPQKVAYRGTISSLRISSVDGTAFLDNCAALVPYADGNHLIEIYDASGNQLKGYLSAQGSGETLSATNHLASLNFTSGWDTITEGTAIIDADSFSTTAPGGVRQVAGTMTASALYKGSLVGSTSAGTVSIRAGSGTVTLASDLIGTAGYGTVPPGSVGELRIYFRNSGAATTDITAASSYVKQVLTPSTDGVLIVSTKGGAVPNFAYKNTSFTYYAATNYVVVRKAR